MTDPVRYSDEVARMICERLADGETLKDICASEGMPHRSTVREWIAINADFRVKYYMAREEYGDAEEKKIVELAHETAPTDERGRVDMGWVQQRRLQVDTRKWRLSKQLPHRFSDRVELTGAAGQALNPPAEELTPERFHEAMRRIAYLLNKAKLQPEAPVPKVLQLVHEVKKA